jgi:hypothetical protein
VTEVGAEERVARRIANFPGRLRGKGGSVKEFGLRPVSTRVEESVGAIPATAVIRHSAISVGLGDRLPVGRINIRRGVVVARSGVASVVENGERLTTLKDCDGVELPSCERLFCYPCPGLAILKLVVRGKRKAALDIILRNTILNLLQPGWVGILKPSWLPSCE